MRLLCPWDSPGKNTRVGFHSLLQGVFPTQYQTHAYCSSCIAGRFFTPWATSGKNLSANAGDTRVMGSIPGMGRSLEEGMVTHPSILAWKIPQAQEPGGLQSMRAWRVKHEWATEHTHTHRTGVPCISKRTHPSTLTLLNLNLLDTESTHPCRSHQPRWKLFCPDHLLVSQRIIFHLYHTFLFCFVHFYFFH